MQRLNMGGPSRLAPRPLAEWFSRIPMTLPHFKPVQARIRSKLRLPSRDFFSAAFRRRFRRPRPSPILAVWGSALKVGRARPLPPLWRMRKALNSNHVHVVLESMAPRVSATHFRYHRS